MLPILAQIPSGLNSTFEQQGLSFTDYVVDMRTRISKARLDLDGYNAETIINANSPFILMPENYDGKRGALLVHGLFDSPYTMRDIANELVKAGILVYAVLLPGHGTVPGDLLNISHQAWIDVTEFGIQQLRLQCEQLYYVGFSTGGGLGIYHALHQAPVDKFIFLAPVRKLQTKVAILNQIFGFTRLLSDNEKWVIKEERYDYAKYLSFPTKAIWEVNRLLELTSTVVNHIQIEQPMLMILTADDESIEVQPSLEFFQHQRNPQHHLIYYTNENLLTDDVRIEQRVSRYVTQNIVDFSHVCLPNAPTNLHYGEHGDQLQPILYSKKNPTQLPIYLGAMRYKPPVGYNLQRLSYNPDFDYMLAQIKTFILKDHSF